MLLSELELATLASGVSITDPGTIMESLWGVEPGEGRRTEYDEPGESNCWI